MTTTVVNKHHGVPYDTYIGRGSPWGNPFVIGKDGDRDEVIDKYEQHLRESPRLLDRLHELRGKTLACFCAPARCHGDILARYADAPPHTPKEEPMRVGTDGGCHPNPGGPGGWAWVADDGTYGCGSFTSGTNNIAELLAIKEALLAHPDEPITIEYDSQYAANCVTKWGPAWRRRGERGKANIDLVYSILDIMDERPRSAKVEWVWVPGHNADNAHPLNTAADLLATRMRKVGSESRESGTVEIDRSAKAPAGRGKPAKRSKPAPKTKYEDWGNMTAVGATCDMSAREVGLALRREGLYDGEPTAKAIKLGAAKWVTRARDKIEFPLWHIAITARLIGGSS